jgi:diguanylate cyclase (GGDEF)-like protein
LSVVMLDVDHFKAFNDAYGHDAGDAVLRRFGTFLKSMVRAEDLACRYGGEEFVIILPEADATIAVARAERIREEAKGLVVDYRDQQLSSISVSLGVAQIGETMMNGVDLLGAADAALYKAKEHGRDQVATANGVGTSELALQDERQ